MTQPAYAIFDNDGNPKLDSIRHHRKNSIATLEAKEWELRQKQGWRCEKIDLIINIKK